MDSAWFRSTFLRVLKFLQIEEWGPNFLGEPILQNGWTICSPLLDLNVKSFMKPNSLSFIRGQCILHDSGALFSETWNFYKLKMGNLISWGNQFCRMSELFGLPFWISILKVLWSQILCHDSGVLLSDYAIGNFYQIKERGPNFLGELILQKVWINWSLLLDFNFKSFLEPNCLSFITGPCILGDLGVLLSESWNF